MYKKLVILIVLLLVGGIVAPALARSHPHHIICEKTEWKANPGDVIKIPYKVHFEGEEDAKNELYGDQVKGWNCTLHSEKGTGKKGEDVSCYIEVHVPKDAKNGTYGLILQDKDSLGYVTSRVSIFIIVGDGGKCAPEQEIHFYDGWIRNEDMPRKIELPVDNFVLTVGVRKLQPATLKLIWQIYGPQGGVVDRFCTYPAKGNHSSVVDASSWYDGGTYTLKIWVYNITDPENEVLLESMEIKVQVLCPGSSNPILLDTLVITTSEVSNQAKGEVSEEEASKGSEGNIITPKPKPEPTYVYKFCFPIHRFFIKILPR